MEITHFISSHDQIDADIQSVKDRNKKMHRIFFAIDILAALIIIALATFLEYKFFVYHDRRDWDAIHNMNFMLFLYPSILEITFSLILAGSAFYLTRSVRKTTGKKQNTCLLNWHILNLVVLIVTLTMYAIFYEKYSE